MTDILSRIYVVLIGVSKQVYINFKNIKIKFKIGKNIGLSNFIYEVNIIQKVVYFLN